MVKKNQRVFNLLNLISDFLILLFAFFLSAVIRFYLFPGVNSIRTGSLITVAVFYAFILVLLYYFFGLYSSARLKRFVGDSLKIIAINAFATLLLVALFYLLRELNFSRWFLIIIWAISCIFIIIKRYFARKMLRAARNNKMNLKHVAVIGNGRLAQGFYKDIADNPEFGINIIGYISAVPKIELGMPLGTYEDLERILEHFKPDALIVALEPHEYDKMSAVLDAADKVGSRVELIPFFNDYFPAHPIIESAGNSKLIDLRATPLDNPGWGLIKRITDIVFSVILIVLTSWIMAIVAAGVKLSSPGPVLFKQKRVGQNKKLFTMYKFRSMRTDASHTGWTTDNDDRKTRFGSFIRKYSLDEFPQFFNVLKGDMSLVGPRPEIPKYVSIFKEEVPLYMIRHQVKPGITGWAQINGLRGDTPIKDRVIYDIWYIENWSLDLDFTILARTVFGGFRNSEKLTKNTKRKKAGNSRRRKHSKRPDANTRKSGRSNINRYPENNGRRRNQ